MTLAQVSLWDVGLSESSARTIRVRFERFHHDHPEVYAGLVGLCRRWREKGSDRWSIDGAFEVLRWTVRTTQADAREAYRLNNNYRSHFARLIMAQEPDLADIFETRVLHAC